MTIHASVIYCEDIREEVDNQYSLVGCFKSHIRCDSFPAGMAKLGVCITWSQSRDEERIPVRVRVLYRETETDTITDVLGAEFDFTSAPDNPGELLVAQAHMRIVGFQAAKPGVFGVRLYRGEQELRLRGLPFLLATQPSTASPA